MSKNNTDISINKKSFCDLKKIQFWDRNKKELIRANETFHYFFKLIY